MWLGGGPVSHVYSVCELLANPSKFDGNEVRVRGIVEADLEGRSRDDEVGPPVDPGILG